MEWWSSVAEGEPAIDVALVRSGPMARGRALGDMSHEGVATAPLAARAARDIS